LDEKDNSERLEGQEDENANKAKTFITESVA
jgi:hypothetical protein